MSQEYCPVCQTKQEEFDKHHVVWETHGGSDDSINILKICKSCHALITFGNTKDRVPRDMACLYYQMSRYGLNFVLRSNLLLSETNPSWYCLIDASDELCTSEIDTILKKAASYLYQRYISVIRGELSYGELIENWWQMMPT